MWIIIRRSARRPYWTEDRTWSSDPAEAALFEREEDARGEINAASIFNLAATQEVQ